MRLDESDEAAAAPGRALEPEAEPPGEPFDHLALLASMAASLDDTEPWQRLGDVLARIIGAPEPGRPAGP